MSSDQRREGGQAVIDRASLRMSTVLLLAGQVLYIVVTQFHTGGEANDHPAIFAAYAGSRMWKAVHIGQFACAAILLAGLVALPFAIGVDAGRSRWAGRFGAVSAGVALALYGVLQAVDGSETRRSKRVGQRPERGEGGTLCEC